MNIIVALLLAFIAPLLLIPVEQLFNYPYVIEEIVKGIAVYLIILQGRSGNKNYFLSAVVVGALFTLSESILYMSNFLAEGTMDLLPKRLLLTGFLHITTCLIMYTLGKKRGVLLIVGLLVSIALHYFFNNLVSHF